ncbi:MAG: deoxyribose-phosphate aldolase [Treponema sp.]|nr:deoxyribose-phosphate aldolase [Treponema sp.]
MKDFSDQEIFARIDHTLLQAAASWEEIKNLCDEAVRFKTASVCIPPAYVKPVFEQYGNALVICTVIGFPLGYTFTSVKAHETSCALHDGASEIDMVINIGDVKNGKFGNVIEEIKTIKKICTEKILKVIIETCYLTEDDKIRLCGIVTEAGADFIKTSTGFGTAGAALADIKLFAQHIGAGVKIKASGGIKTRADMVNFINAGADRLGTSSAVKLLAGGGATVC